MASINVTRLPYGRRSPAPCGLSIRSADAKVVALQDFCIKARYWLSLNPRVITSQSEKRVYAERLLTAALSVRGR